jgi:uncharacterized protein YndB with AHSA1/START domain
MSRQGVTKHLDVLHRADLLQVELRGRERIHRLNPTPMRELADWLAPYSAAWDDRPDQAAPTPEGAPMTETPAIEKTLELDAPIDRVWRAISDPAELTRWFPKKAEWELQPGHMGTFTWGDGEVFPIRVEKVEAPNHLAWSWGHESDREPVTLVEWWLTSRDDGGTTLKLRETGFVDPKHREDNVDGWTEELAELADLLAT